MISKSVRQVVNFFVFTTLFSMLISCDRMKRHPEIRIHYLGHASFIIDFEGQTRVLTDYGTSRAWGLDSPIFSFSEMCPDVLTTSHKHHIDHFGRALPCNIPHQLSGTDSLNLNHLTITPVGTNENWSETPDNTSFVFTYRGITIVHLGDAQSDIMSVDSLDQTTYRKRFPEQIDLLLMTIQGVQEFIKEAEAFIRMMRPRRCIPMHYWSEAYKAQFLEYLESFPTSTGTPYTVQRVDGADYEWTELDPSDPSIRIISLEPAPLSYRTGTSRSEHNE